MKTQIKPVIIIHKYYAGNDLAEKILLSHSRLVATRALQISRYLQTQGALLNLRFIAEAAMLHDIGMIFTNTPELGCNGDVPYLQHGLKGKDILLKEGLPAHARVCERHIGVGLSATEIEQQNLPLPISDIYPETLEEQIICYADLFYSKSSDIHSHKKNPDEVRAKLREYGSNKIEIFDRWLNEFEPQLN